MGNKLILLDQDGVLADFELGVRRSWQQKFNQPIPLGERHHFYLRDDMPEKYHQALHQVYASRGFFARLPPIDGAIEAAQQLLHAGHDVRICTSPIMAYQYCMAEKFDWVRQYLGEAWLRRVIITKDKTWVRGDILIDDKPCISGSLSPQWQHWLYDQPYNRSVAARHRVCWRKPDSWRYLLD
ncbi:5'-3'-deoxyribonucleotidase [Neisseriaceae bacterium ESL0693]|nr:5'-3'-deoxyribonucleotidase [Neisseriaceae bacterium ESL0693]